MRAHRLLVMLGLVSPLAAQGAPGSDIYVATLSGAGGALAVGAPANVTARAGYDNQPWFAPDGRSFYYTSGRDGQTDIYRYDFRTGQGAAVTTTAESEYSPQLMPDGSHLSVIRVERDSAQRLWSFSLEGAALKPVLDSLKPIGYHIWLGPDTVFVFVLGSPATLQRAIPSRQTAEIVARDIGRTLLRVPGRHAVSYLQRDSSGGRIRSLDPVSGAGADLAPLPGTSEFYAWTPQGDLLSSRGNALVRWSPATQRWETVAQFSEPGLQRITRLAVSAQGDRIALVGEDGKP